LLCPEAEAAAKQSRMARERRVSPDLNIIFSSGKG
jgi:hypothetical protein